MCFDPAPYFRPKRIPRSYPFSRKRGYFFKGRRVIKNTTYIEMSSVWCNYIYFDFYKKGTLAYITKKWRFALKKGGGLLGLKISDFGWKRGVFFSSKVREKGGFFKLACERGIRFGREWRPGFWYCDIIIWGIFGDRPSLIEKLHISTLERRMTDHDSVCWCKFASLGQAKRSGFTGTGMEIYYSLLVYIDVLNDRICPELTLQRHKALLLSEKQPSYKNKTVGCRPPDIMERSYNGCNSVCVLLNIWNHITSLFESAWWLSIIWYLCGTRTLATYFRYRPSGIQGARVF